MDAPLPSLPPSSSPPPPPPHASTSAHSSGNALQSSPSKRSPAVSRKISLDLAPSSVPLPRSPRSSPTPTRKGYTELQFENSSPNTAKFSPVPERREVRDVPNKFNYSKLQFENDKEKEHELVSSKVAKKPPPPPRYPPPRYQGKMMKNFTDSSLQNAEHGLCKGRSSLPTIEKNLDYAEVVFDNSRMSPSTPHCVLEAPNETPPQEDHSSPRTDAPSVLYSTVILTQTHQKVKKNDKVKDKPRPDGYENFDFNPNKQIDDGYVNFDFAPTSKRQADDLTHGPTVTGSARLLKSDAPQAKPR